MLEMTIIKLHWSAYKWFCGNQTEFYNVQGCPSSKLNIYSAAKIYKCSPISVKFIHFSHISAKCTFFATFCCFPYFDNDAFIQHALQVGYWTPLIKALLINGFKSVS